MHERGNPDTEANELGIDPTADKRRRLVVALDAATKEDNGPAIVAQISGSDRDKTVTVDGNVPPDRSRNEVTDRDRPPGGNKNEVADRDRAPDLDNNELVVEQEPRIGANLQAQEVGIGSGETTEDESAAAALNNR